MKARELLSDKSKWVKGYSSVDSRGLPVQFYDPTAVKWCILGAVCRCYRNGGDAKKLMLLERATKTTFNRTAADFNDDPITTFQQVKALLEKLDI